MIRRIDIPNTDADEKIITCLGQSTSFIMVSGAGSGKTTSLIKALYYIEKTCGDQLRKRKQKVACITYTTGAEKEILSDIGDSSVFHVSTIHSFLWSLIKPFQVNIKIWVIERIKQKIEKLNEEAGKFGQKTQQKTRVKNSQEIEKYTDILSKIVTVKVFKYETGSNYLKGILGHDDIIKMVPVLIKDYPLLKNIIKKKYPFFFVDESQDTVSEVIDALKSVESHDDGISFCLGFFGDPMQKIYLTGVGEIAPGSNWAQITKIQNYRCPAAVLEIINNIRRQSDDFQQTLGAEGNDLPAFLATGTARIFILPSDSKREENLTLVREFIARENNDSIWRDNQVNESVRVLVLEHRMAAKRLKFSELYAAFKDNATEAMSSQFLEGDSWALQPFQKILFPLVDFYNKGKTFEVIELLRKYCPLINKDNLKNISGTAPELLLSIKNNVYNLTELLDVNSSVSVREVLKFVEDTKMIILDERISQRLNNIDNISLSDDADQNDKVKITMESYFLCPVSQIWGYQKYISNESPYSTQHSIKGSEFDRVLVILDDEEGKNSTLYSYEKLLGIKNPSETDMKNLAGGIDSVYDRTRRLFYVCCSRSRRDLAVVLFVSDVPGTLLKIKEGGIFQEPNVKILEDLK